MISGYFLLLKEKIHSLQNIKSGPHNVTKLFFSEIMILLRLKPHINTGCPSRFCKGVNGTCAQGTVQPNGLKCLILSKELIPKEVR